MKVLLTGAFGNVGTSTLEALLKKSTDEITCFDKPTIATRKESRKYKGQIKVIWGDLRNPKKVAKAVENQDVVLHIGAIIPPKANRSRKETNDINFGGTKNIVDAINKQTNKPKLVYTSSIAVYGDVRHLGTHTVSIEQPFNPSPHDHYAVTKIKSEEYIRNSGVEYIIYRLSYIPNAEKMSLTPLMFRMPLDTPIEFTHTKDTGLALANTVDNKDMWNNIYNLGGGKSCQLYYREFLEKMLPLMGVGMLPEEAFSKEPFHCCFYDTTDLQKKLKFQEHDMKSLLDDMVANTKAARVFAKIFKPIVRPFLLMLSPYYAKNKRMNRKLAKQEKKE
ncbi:MAG TPA: NAD(P)-dependent oxidoreductase [Candidatus Bathyarchaeia archaeon]|nr:NAD(P)-dependent oxidoreductase [Candidatus Bathyarchaeia archaeon]